MATDTLTLTDAEYRAGAEYLAALRRLRFEPDVLCWSSEMLDVDNAEAGFEKRLTLVTSLVDSVGARAIYDLLFKAYEASATPKEIDPFIVSVYSPASYAGAQILGALTERTLSQADEAVANMRATSDKPDTGAIIFPAVLPHRNGGFVLPQAAPLLEGIYVVKTRKTSSVYDSARFDRFRRQVERLAA